MITRNILTIATMLLAAELPADAEKAARWVLPPMPGKELRKLVGADQGPLPTGYKFAGARIERSIIVAKYRSIAGGKNIEIVLGHQNQLQGAHARTSRFAVRIRPAPRNTALQRTLKEFVARVRREEHRWHWKSVSSSKHRNKPSKTTRPTVRKSWQIEITVYLVFCMVLGILVNWVVHRSKLSPTIVKRTWDRYDTRFVFLVIGVAAFHSWAIFKLPITGDEASILEPNFWSTWFLAARSSSHPPLHRMLVHLTITSPDHLWLMRLPSLLFGLGCLWLLYRILRRRTNGPIAFSLVVLFACSGQHLRWFFQQKSYTLWMLLILATQDSFERALKCACQPPNVGKWRTVLVASAV